MNIFLDKSLPKKTQVALQILRGVLFILIFGGLFVASFYPEAQNAILYISVGVAIIFWTVKFWIERKRKRLAENAHSITKVQGSDTRNDELN